MNHVSSSFFSPLITQGAYGDQDGCRHSELGEMKLIPDTCTTNPLMAESGTNFHCRKKMKVEDNQLSEEWSQMWVPNMARSFQFQTLELSPWVERIWACSPFPALHLIWNVTFGILFNLTFPTNSKVGIILTTLPEHWVTWWTSLKCSGISMFLIRTVILFTLIWTLFWLPLQRQHFSDIYL